MKLKLTTIGLILGAVLVGAGATGAILQWAIPSSFDFYNVISLTFTPETIYWGNLTVGESSVETVNVTNIGNIAVNLTAGTDTSPTPSFNYTFTWDAEGTILQPSDWILANFTFTLYNAPSTGGFNIIISDQS